MRKDREVCERIKMNEVESLEDARELVTHAWHKTKDGPRKDRFWRVMKYIKLRQEILDSFIQAEAEMFQRR